MPNRNLLVSPIIVFVIVFAAFVSAQTVNVWTNVTPASVPWPDQINGSYGTETVGVDPMQPSDLYANFNQQGIFKSTDYGATWNGPINTGTNGSDVTGDGNMTVASGGAGKPAILYVGNVHNYSGFWRSTDGGVDWQTFNIAPAASRQDVYPPDVDPYDPQHIVVTGHEHTATYESKDGGQTWSNVTMDPGMNAGTGYAFFVNTGTAATTAQTLLWIGQGSAGTWRTTNDGTNWTRVDLNNFPGADGQLYQPGNGVVFMAGGGSALGNGILRSTNYGQTWTHVGPNVSESGVFGTPNHVYAMTGSACVPCSQSPSLEVAPQPGTSGWAGSSTPSGMNGGGYSDAAVTYDGTHYIIVASCWDRGLWRYVESSPTSVAAGRSSLIVKTNFARPAGIMLTKIGIAIRSTGGGFYDVKGRAEDKIILPARGTVVP